MENMIGQQIGAYKIVALLGKGGMAEVYRAHQQLGGRVARDVALKLIDSRLSLSPEFIARFEREAQTLVSMSHPHILKAFDYGQYQDTVYLVMELLLGGSLAELIRKRLLPLSDVSRLLEQTGQALDYAHRQGIIHRDLKPQNVLLDNESNAFLTDFGIVKLLGESTSLTQSNASIGTPAYMAPEQWVGGAIDARTDLYALGVMLYEMLGGHVPFTGDTPYRVMYLHTNQLPPSLFALRPDIPPTIDRVISKALAKDPAARYESAAALLADFKAALADHPVSAPPATLLPPAPSVPGLAPISSPLPNTPTYVSSAPPIDSSASGRRLSPVLSIVAALIVVAIAGIGLVAILDGLSGGTPILSWTPSAVPPSLTHAIALAPSQAPTTIPPTMTPQATLSPIALTRLPLPTNTVIETAVPTNQLASTLATFDAVAAAQTELALESMQTATLFTATPTENRTATVAAARSIILTTTAIAATTQQAVLLVASYTKTFTSTPTATNTPRSTLAPTQTLTPTPTSPVAPTPTPTPTSTVTANKQWTPRIQSFNGVPMALVPAGCFQMGSPSPHDISAQIKDQAQRQVCLSTAFWIDQYEVSNAEYQQFINAGGYQTRAYWTDAGWQWLQDNKRQGPTNFQNMGLSDPQQPRVGVSLFEAEAYAHWRDGRIPTEAEWEFAARGPDSLIYPWGNIFENGRANIRGVAGRTVDVQNYPNGASWVGALNMAGNAGEWVSDCYNQAYDQSMVKDNPVGPCDGSNEMVKGSSWAFDQFPAQASYRFVNAPHHDWFDVGIRVVSNDK
ncbi:MAG: protein kinase domain-containing protein [Aggregatilineales bacterium]